MRTQDSWGKEGVLATPRSRGRQRRLGDRVGQQYPDLNDIIGVTICDFELWPRAQWPQVPMLSRWRMQEQHGCARSLGQLQFVFLELPKYDTSRPPGSMVEKWAYFSREASNLEFLPEVLAEQPFKDALGAARVAHFSEAAWEAYIRAGMAIQDERAAWNSPPWSNGLTRPSPPRALPRRSSEPPKGPLSRWR